MLTLDADEFLGVIEFLTSNQGALKDLKGTLTPLDIKKAKNGIAEAIIRLDKLDLPVSVAAARQLLDAVALKDHHSPARDYPKLHRGFEQIE